MLACLHFQFIIIMIIIIIIIKIKIIMMMIMVARCSTCNCVSASVFVVYVRREEGPAFLVCRGSRRINCQNVLCIRQEVGSKSEVSRLVKDQPLQQEPIIIMSSMNISAVSQSSSVRKDRMGY